ncbi:hypothetical protein ON010_g14082 [Phytophthora cinnamomi]|nr:hypothetical protein ON010_g14082 [Phytophthora cinnamomi]
MNIINAYAPHMDRSIEETDRFYADLATTHNKLPRCDLTFVLGDFNAKPGQPRDGEHCAGNWARGYRNRNGHLLATFCELHGLTATNTFFRKRAQNLTTWMSDTASTIKSTTCSVRRPSSSSARMPTHGAVPSLTPITS